MSKRRSASQRASVRLPSTPSHIQRVSVDDHARHRHEQTAQRLPKRLIPKSSLNGYKSQILGARIPSESRTHVVEVQPPSDLK